MPRPAPADAPAGSDRDRASGPSRRIRPRLWVELALIAAGYGLYSLIRDAVPTHRTAALHRATAVLNSEHWLHVDVELTVNQALNKVTPLIVGMNYYYATLHFAVTIGVLVWLYVRRPAVYRQARTVLCLATAASLIGFYFFALAPPRFLTAHGYIDTVVVHHTWGSWGSAGVDSVSNQYAAMPSDHIAWATWCAVMLYLYAEHRWVRYAALLYPLFTLTVIVATANHFLADAGGGLLTITVAFAVVRWTPATPPPTDGPSPPARAARCFPVRRSRRRTRRSRP